MSVTLADAKDFLKLLPDGSVDCVFTDPPYSFEAHGRGLAGKRKIYKEMAEWTKEGVQFFNDCWLDEYIRVCKFPNVLLFMNESELTNVLWYAKNHGLISTRVIPILKKTPMPFTNNNWLANEYLVHLTDRKLGYCKDYHYKLPYFIMAAEDKVTKHPNEKSLAICRQVLINCTKAGQKVLDCFAGSGTIGCACALEKRGFIGCDCSAKWVDFANKRIQETSKEGFLF